jgi:hypothetical protein
MLGNPKKLETQHPPFDAITVQSAGLRMEENGTYASTLYSSTDEFGMLGGNMRVLAAQELYWLYPASAFVFCNGKSAKQIAKFGPEVPTDAEIYAEEFKRGIDQSSRDKFDEKLLEPKIFLEDKSVNTVASIGLLLGMCTTHDWKRIGLVSSDYHIPRIQALCDLIFKKLGDNPVEISFISAEAVLKELRPGMYDEEIDDAYQTVAAQERLKNEENGLQDIKAGRYHIGEFQLAPKD